MNAEDDALVNDKWGNAIKLCREIDLFLAQKGTPTLENQLALSALSVIASQYNGLDKQTYLLAQDELWDMLE